MTSTSAYLAACAEATQPLMRTVFFFFSTTVAMSDSPLPSRFQHKGHQGHKGHKGSALYTNFRFVSIVSFVLGCCVDSTLNSQVPSPPVLNILRLLLRHHPQLLGLASVQPRRNGERRFHAHDAGVEI